MRWPLFKRSRIHCTSSSPEAQQPEVQTAHAYGVYYHSHNIPECLPAKTVWGACVGLENSGNRTWQFHHPEGHRVDLVVICDGQVWSTHYMPRTEVHPGESVILHFPLRVPGDVGVHHLCLDLVEQGVTLFADQGAAPLTLQLLVGASPAQPEHHALRTSCTAQPLVLSTYARD